MSDDGDYDVDAGDFDGDDIADDIDEAGGEAGVMAVTIVFNFSFYYISVILVTWIRSKAH